MRIPDKQTFKRLSSALRLGNHFRTWDSLADLEASGYRGSVTQQALLPGLSSTELFIPNISVADVLERSRGVTDAAGRSTWRRCTGTAVSASVTRIIRR